MSIDLETFFHDGRQSETALSVRRGVSRFLALGHIHVLAEVTLPTGRRADLIGLDAKGQIVIVEIKSSLADWQADQKWQDYLEFCDQLYFACPPEMDASVFPETAGLLVADSYGAELIRSAPETGLAAARRKKITLLFARAGAQRVMRALDPQGFGDFKSGF